MARSRARGHQWLPVDPVWEMKKMTQAMIDAGKPNFFPSPEDNFEHLSAVHFFSTMQSFGMREPLIFDQQQLLMTSLHRIKNKWQWAYAKGTVNSRTASANIKKQSLLSVQESCRRLFLANQERDVADAGSERMAMMLSTTAENSDFEHSLYEGVIMPESRLLAILERPGCRHMYQVMM